MKILQIYFTVLLAILISGCTSKTGRVELNKETFFSTNFDASQVSEVNIVFAMHTANWKCVDENVFPIRDKARIKTIFNCMFKGGTFAAYSGRMIGTVELNLLTVDGNNTFQMRVKDPTQINNILIALRTDRDPSLLIDRDPKSEHRMIIFLTPDTIFYTSIRWDKEFVYGDWWESTELRKYFELWGIK